MADNGSQTIPISESAGPQKSPPVAKSWRQIPLGDALAVAVVAGALGFAYWTTLTELVQIWKREPDYSHGFLVIPIAVVILYQLWPRDPADQPRVWLPGLAITLVGLIAQSWLLSRGSLWSTNLTLLVTVFGLGIARLGPRAMMRVWPAFAFLIFLFPLPSQLNNVLSQPLQSGATVAACKVLRASGLWVMNEGNVIIVGKEPLEVAAACNGLSMLMSLAATVAAAAALFPMAWVKRVILLVTIIPIALLSNILRISATAWAYHALGAKVGGAYAHDLAGFLMMPLAMVFVGIELLVMSWVFVESTTENDLLFNPLSGAGVRVKLGEGRG